VALTQLEQANLSVALAEPMQASWKLLPLPALQSLRYKHRWRQAFHASASRSVALADIHLHELENGFLPHAHYVIRRSTH
jgi:hypothetical protein